MQEEKNISRREFLAASLIGLSYMAGLPSCNIFSKQDNEKQPSKKISGKTSAGMPTRKLGGTDYDVRLFSLGGQSALEPKDNMDNAVRIINRALELGVNYFDSAPLYGDSELYYGEALKARRNDIFLATKTHKRTYDSAMRLLERSLQRLNTDYLDLWQIHNVEDKYDVEDIFAKNGVWKAIAKAKEEKVTKYVGITGHYDPLVLKTAIERFDFDTILMSLNAADKHLKPFIQNLLPTAVEKNMGIIGMKVLARGRIINDNGISNPKDAIEYVLSLPVSTIIVGCDNIEQLEQNVKIASEFKPLDETALKHIEDLTASYYKEANFFKIEH